MVLEPPFITALIIPTGIGASVGGFAGDAMPVLNLLASVSDVLITHPNVANAAVFQDLPSNGLYVEGYGLDQFFKGLWGLRPVRKNKVGVLFDRGIEPEMLTHHLNVINAVQIVYGLDILPPVHTSKPIDVSVDFSPSGTSTGQIGNPDVLLEGCEALLREGADAIALCVQIPDLDGEESYETGEGVDPIGGIEAILSHLVVSTFQVPCAHSPVFSIETAMPILDRVVDSKAAAEYIAPTFLPCVLRGLAKAPRFVERFAQNRQEDIWIEDLSALVVPHDVLGGSPMLNALERGISVISVAENRTIVSLGTQSLETLLSAIPQKSFLQVDSYLEAVGLLQAIKIGHESFFITNKTRVSPRSDKIT